jgi:hypothetical protein
MAATITQTRTFDTQTRTFDKEPPVAVVEEIQVSDGLRIARYCMLDELPGLIFGVMTVGYIVLSFVGLKP